MSCNKCKNICNDCECTCKTSCAPHCECPVKLDSDCVTVRNSTFTCSSIEDAQTLTEVLNQIDAFICEKFDLTVSFFSLLNVGGGAQVYKGVDGIGRKLIRTLVNASLITITQNTDTITISLDEEGLYDFIRNNQKTYTAENTTGVIGEGIVTTSLNTPTTNNTQFNYKKFASTDGSIVITPQADYLDFSLPVIADTSIKEFIVNSAYDIGGTAEQLGTLSKPFKTIQGALNAYMGASTDITDPDNFGAKVIIKKGIGYTFTGNFNYNGITIEIESGVNINSNPIDDWLVNLDIVAISPTTKFEVTLILGEGSLINLSKNGFNNSGTTTNNSEFINFKKITIISNGNILQDIQNLAFPYVIFQSNFINSSNFYNDDSEVFVLKNCSVNTQTQPIYKIGGYGRVSFSSVIFTIGNPGVDSTGLKPFQISGGTVEKINTQTEVLFNGLDLYTISKDISIPCNLFTKNDTFSGNIGTLYNVISTESPALSIINGGTNTQLNVVDLFLSPTLLTTVLYNFNFITYVQNNFSTQVDFSQDGTISVINKIGDNIIESLKRYGNRGIATLSAPTGTKFINTGGIASPTTGWFIDIVM